MGILLAVPLLAGLTGVGWVIYTGVNKFFGYDYVDLFVRDNLGLIVVTLVVLWFFLLTVSLGIWGHFDRHRGG